MQGYAKAFKFRFPIGVLSEETDFIYFQTITGVG
jgi:hypothetical protein